MHGVVGYFPKADRLGLGYFAPCEALATALGDSLLRLALRLTLFA